MKLYGFVLIMAFASTCFASSMFEEIESIGFFQALLIEQIDSARCVARGNHTDETRQAIECLKKVKSSSSFCETFLNHFKPCVQVLIDGPKNCKSNDNFELVMAIINSLLAEAKFICGTNGEHIFEILNPCVSRSFQKSEDCVEKSLDIVNKKSKEHRTNDSGSHGIMALCPELPRIKKCFTDEFDKECTNDITKDTFKQFLGAEAEPCNVGLGYYFALGGYIYTY